MSVPPFDRLLGSHGESVLRFLVAAVGPQEAEDCFQETLEAALRAYPSLSNGANLRAWILKIAQRKAIDHHRSRRQRPVIVEYVPEVPVHPLVGDESGIWDAVRALPPKQRDAITHRYVNDLSYKEVGEILGCSEEAARQNARHGLNKLRKVWSQ